LENIIKIKNLHLKNPLTLASGTAGYGEELADYFDISKLGAIFSKGLSLEPRQGNKGNRIIETPAGVLNSIGLENVGLEVFLDEKLPFLVDAGATVIPNVAGHTEEENVEMCRILSKTDGIDAVELNLSCPNVKEGGMAFGVDIDIFTRLITKVRAVTDIALIIKLSPNVTDISLFAKAAEDCGADAISAINTLLGMKIDTSTGKPYFNNGVAGLSGPAIKPVALRCVYQIYQKVKIPIIGLGGISNFNDMLEFIMAGASAVSIGTMNMIDPEISVKLIKEFDDYIEEKNISSIKDIIGLSHR
jgi:dihydroorotate dehydrogenase (NAD+) catalytic subunit